MFVKVLYLLLVLSSDFKFYTSAKYHLKTRKSEHVLCGKEDRLLGGNIRKQFEY